MTAYAAPVSATPAGPEHPVEAAESLADAWAQHERREAEKAKP